MRPLGPFRTVTAVDAEARRWTMPRSAIAVVLVALVVLDIYAMYSGWFGWNPGGERTWDDRNGRGVALAAPLVVGLVFVLWGWPRIFGRIRSDLARMHREEDNYRSTHSWD
jgi:hypothetical protein